MKPNEVRIDNWVMGYLDKNPVKVDWLVIKHLLDGNIQSVYDPKPVYEPIPLTPEILEKCGFEKEVEDYFLQVNQKLTLCKYPDEDKVFLFKDNDFGNNYICLVEYVHQLQNLFFALTGEELNYQP